MNAWLSGEAAWQVAGWTMLHFLWAGTAIAVAGGAVRVACRRLGPGVRYGVSLATLALLAAAPVGIAWWVAQHSPLAAERTSAVQPADLHEAPKGAAASVTTPGRVIDLARTPVVAPQQAAGVAGATNASATSVEHQTTALRSVATGDRARLLPSLPGRGITLEALASWLPWVWLAGAPATFLLLATGLVGSRRLRRRCAEVTEGAAAEACRRLCAAMKISRRVTLAACDGVVQPVLVGIVRPTILLPAAALTGWTTEELEMVLMHELTHVRRWDNLVNLMQRLVESALFFHPAVWLASRQVRRDREDCCDAAVVAYTRRPTEYAELLVSMAGRVRAGRGRRGARIAEATLAMGCGLADHPLAGRIRRILKLEDEPMRVSGGTLGVAIVLAASLLAAAVALPPTSGANADDASNPSRVAAAKRRGEEGAQNTPRTKSRSASRAAAASSSTASASSAAPAKKAAATREAIANSDRVAQLKRAVEESRAHLALLHEERDANEVARAQALTAAQSAGTLEEALARRLADDPQPRELKEKLADLQAQLDQLRANPAKEHADVEQAMIRQMKEIERAQAEYSAMVEQDIRARLALAPNETMQSAMKEYQARSRSLEQRIAAMEAQLAAAQAQLAAGGAQAERRNKRSRSSVKGTAHVLDGAVRPEELRTLFEESEANPRTTAAYSGENLPAELRKQLPVVFDGLINDPYGPRLKFEYVSERGGEQFLITAPRAAHFFFRMIFAGKLTEASASQHEHRDVYRQENQNRHGQLEQLKDVYAADQEGANQTIEERERPKELVERRSRPAAARNQSVVPLTTERRVELVEESLRKLEETIGRLEQSPNEGRQQQYERAIKLYDHLMQDADDYREDAERALQAQRASDSSEAPAAPWENDLVRRRNAARYEDLSKKLAAAQARLVELSKTPDGATTPTNQSTYNSPAGGASPTNGTPQWFYHSAQPQGDAGTAEWPGATNSPAAVDYPRRDPNLVEASPSQPVMLQAGDRLMVQAAGVDPEQPLQAEFAVEAEGTLPLGPLYGRVKVQGLTVLEAQAAIEKHLKTLFKAPSVQAVFVPSVATYASIAAGTGTPTTIGPVGVRAPAGDVFLYDGKSFDEWSSLWRNELKTEKRMEAIDALAAFGRAGMGADAAEAILEVAGQYNFYSIDTSIEGQLKQRVIELLTTTSSSRVPETDWMPALVRRLEAEPERWKWLGYQLLLSLQTENKDVRKLLFKLAENPDESIREAALTALGHSDPARTNPQVLAIIDQLLASEDAADVKMGIGLATDVRPARGGAGRAASGMRKPEAIFKLLFHEDESVKQAARAALLLIDQDEASKLAQALVGKLNQSDDLATRLAAVRGVAALGIKAAEVEPAIAPLVSSSENPKIAVAAAVAVDRMHEDAGTSPGTTSLWEQMNPPGISDGRPFIDGRAPTREAAALFPEGARTGF